MLEQLDVQPGHAVLEIGAGTGYNAALLAHMVGETGRVVSVDIDQDPVEAARAHLAATGFDRGQVVCADGGQGYLEAAPYDRIVLTVGAADILPAWIEQLKPDGRMVLPLVITETAQQSIAFERNGEHLVSRSLYNCGFMMLRGAFASATLDWAPLGPDPGLFVASSADHPVDAGQVYAWLMGPRRDWETGVELSLREVFFALGLWMTLNGVEGHSLVAQGEMVDRDIVPPLAGYGGAEKSVSTDVLLGDGGMAALMRPPGQSAPLAEEYDPSVFEASFSLYVRQFGPDESLAQRLVERIRAWHAAGRPSTEGLRLRAYSKDVDYAPGEGEFLLERRWTRLVLDWPEARKNPDPD
jgi:protein-L-isoaspartate(D-aspartate) O-methyltransferase